jgi:hypothetical protein
MVSVPRFTLPIEVPELQDISARCPQLPERMAYRCGWEEGREEVTMFIDEDRGDGWLVLAEGYAAEEHICTLYWSGRTLHGVIWRGPATDRPQAWRDEQQGHIRDALAR